MATSPVKNTADLFALLRREKILERFRLKHIGVFGSMARGERFNDIDLLVEDDVDYKTLIELKQYLEALTGHKIDVLQRQFAEPVILHRALKEVCRYAAAS